LTYPLVGMQCWVDLNRLYLFVLKIATIEVHEYTSSFKMKVDDNKHHLFSLFFDC
jgi:hypothetical protein